jgi:hypothetical protein
MPRTEWPGASIEVLEYRWALHLEECAAAFDVVLVECPCGRGLIELCRSCHEPVFFALLDDEVPCEHLGQFFDGWLGS